jgi:phage gp36-like protein
VSTEALITEGELRALALGEKAGFEDSELEAVILAASSTAYSYIRSRYRLPLVTWGHDLRLAVAKIATYIAFSSRGFDPSNPADQVILKNYDDAIAWLKDVAGNRAAADVVDTSPAPALSPRVISNTPRGYGRVAPYVYRRRCW